MFRRRTPNIWLRKSERRHRRRGGPDRSRRLARMQLTRDKSRQRTPNVTTYSELPQPGSAPYDASSAIGTSTRAADSKMNLADSRIETQVTDQRGRSCPRI